MVWSVNYTKCDGKKIFRNKIKDKIIRDIRTLFETKKEEWKKKMRNGRINKDRIFRSIRTLFETEEEKKKENN